MLLSLTVWIAQQAAIVKGLAYLRQRPLVPLATIVLVASPLQHHQTTFVSLAFTALLAAQYRHSVQRDTISQMQVARLAWRARKDATLMSSEAMRL